jgi:hypothetical protein
MNLNDDVVYRCPRLGPLRQLHPGRSRSLVGQHDRPHRNRLLMVRFFALAGYLDISLGELVAGIVRRTQTGRSTNH